MQAASASQEDAPASESETPAEGGVHGSVSSAIMHFVAQRRKKQEEIEQAGGPASENPSDGMT